MIVYKTVLNITIIKVVIIKSVWNVNHHVKHVIIKQNVRHVKQDFYRIDNANDFVHKKIILNIRIRHV